MYSNWNSTSYYMPQNYQEPAKPDYYQYTTNYNEQSYVTEEHDNHDNDNYTFLPKPTFYEAVFSNALDLCRNSTDVTENGDKSPLSYNTTSPNSGFIPVIQPNTYNSNTIVPTYSENLTNNYHTIPNNNLEINPMNNNTFIDTPNTQPTPLINETIKIAPIPMSSKTIKKEESDSTLEEEESSGSESIEQSQLKSLMRSNIWDEEKDETLTKLGVQYKCDWKKIAKKFNHKKITPHFLKIRYKELICAPLQRRMKFDHKEDLMIAKYFSIYGSNWSQMATHFKDRSPIMLKNRYYSFIRKRDLMDGLMKEVKEIEQENQLVDDIKEMGCEGSSRKSSGESYAEEPTEKKVKSSRKQSKVKEVNTAQEDEGKDLAAEEEIQKEMALKFENDKKIKALENRVKSFQGLYLKAKKDLEMLKGSMQL